MDNHKPDLGFALAELVEKKGNIAFARKLFKELQTQPIADAPVDPIQTQIAMKRSSYGEYDLRVLATLAKVVDHTRECAARAGCETNELNSKAVALFESLKPSQNVALHLALQNLNHGYSYAGALGELMVRHEADCNIFWGEGPKQ